MMYIRKIFLMLLASITLISCKESEIPFFTEENLCNIFRQYEYSGSITGYGESTGLNAFTGDYEEEDSRVIRVIIYGVNDDISRDRVIKLKYDGDFDKSKQPGLPESVTIPANEMSVVVEVTLYNHTAVEGKENKIYILPDESSGYKIGAGGALTINLNN